MKNVKEGARKILPETRKWSYLKESSREKICHNKFNKIHLDFSETFSLLIGKRRFFPLNENLLFL